MRMCVKPSASASSASASASPKYSAPDFSCGFTSGKNWTPNSMPLLPILLRRKIRPIERWSRKRGVARLAPRRRIEKETLRMSSNGKVALVTGAGSGIGKASALALAREGFAVVLAGRRAEPLEKAAGEIEAAGGKALAVPTDIADPAQVKALFAKAKATFGRLDVLFNNAGF